MVNPRKLRQQIGEIFEIVPNRCTATEIVIICPEPGCGDKSGNRGISLKNGQTSCWRCNKGGPFSAWARRLGHDIPDIDDSASVSEVDKLMAEMAAPGVTTPVTSGLPLPAGFTKIADDPGSVYTRLIGKMARRKNLDLDDFVRAGVGFTRTDPLWEPYAIFPIDEWGRTVYYQGRTYRDIPGEPTKRFPSNKACQFGSKYWVYNIDEARRRKARTLVVVESILNVLSLEREVRRHAAESEVVPVAVFKHKASAPQLAKLAQLHHARELCLLFDSDATADAWKQARLMAGRLSVTVAEMPKTENARFDANDDAEAAWAAVENRRAFNPVSELDALLSSSRA